MNLGAEHDILVDVTSAIGNPEKAAPQRVAALNRPNVVSVGTIVFLSQELMFFAGLFAMYFTSRANGIGNGSWEEGAHHLNVPYALLISVILVSSSVTAQFGVFAAERGDLFGLRRWYALTILLGSIFLVGQSYEYYELVHHGLTIPSSVYGSVFFITTGFHAAHVLAGVTLSWGVYPWSARSRSAWARTWATVVGEMPFIGWEMIAVLMVFLLRMWLLSWCGAHR